MHLHWESRKSWNWKFLFHFFPTTGWSVNYFINRCIGIATSIDIYTRRRYWLTLSGRDHYRFLFLMFSKLHKFYFKIRTVFNWSNDIMLMFFLWLLSVMLTPIVLYLTNVRKVLQKSIIVRYYIIFIWVIFYVAAHTHEL